MSMRHYNKGAYRQSAHSLSLLSINRFGWGSTIGLGGVLQDEDSISNSKVGRYGTDVPKGHKRIRRTDPRTGEVHTLDLPIPDGKAFDRLLDMLRLGIYEGLEKVAPDLKDWELEFIKTGHYQPE